MFMSTSAKVFDAAYYHRYYTNPKTCAASRTEQRRLADFISSYLKYLQLPVGEILDLGCGLGILLHRLQQRFPRARCVGVELSPYLVEHYGWQAGSVVDYEDESFDLVTCTDVLGYLSSEEASLAIKNLAKLCHGALYLSVITTEDLDICDPEHSDMDQQVRPYAWYQKQLAPYFESIGGGLLLRRPVKTPIWRMERA